VLIAERKFSFTLFTHAEHGFGFSVPCVYVGYVCMYVCSHFSDKTAEDISTKLDSILDHYISIYYEGQMSRLQG